MAESGGRTFVHTGMVELKGHKGYFVDTDAMKLYHNGKEMKPLSGVFKLYDGHGKFLRVGVNRVLYAALHGLPVELLKQKQVVFFDGKPILKEDMTAHMREVRTYRVLNRSKKDQLRRIDEYIAQMQRLRKAIETNNFREVMADLEDEREKIYSMLRNRYGYKDPATLKDIYEEAQLRLIEHIIDRKGFCTNYISMLQKLTNAVVKERRQLKRVPQWKKDKIEANNS